MYLIKTRGISYDEAFELVRVRRPLIKVLLLIIIFVLLLNVTAVKMY
jgi:hypothetical protein